MQYNIRCVATENMAPASQQWGFSITFLLNNVFDVPQKLRGIHSVIADIIVLLKNTALKIGAKRMLWHGPLRTKKKPLKKFLSLSELAPFLPMMSCDKEQPKCSMFASINKPGLILTPGLTTRFFARMISTSIPDRPAMIPT
ncbi:hypothetical protein NECAME_12178 [Necator americanus]|uniref:Uncharacterized protein n=1 Tax=Necator americanus TaxID=51031 RepID=W2T1H5_NECAM|nr:hypothetical protein NECAME_12178 [Necator americanus]ETN75748.1 hypothetical protein NECAME_12178 [Necator americanus]